jgi:hypothetical protein
VTRYWSSHHVPCGTRHARLHRLAVSPRRPLGAIAAPAAVAAAGTAIVARTSRTASSVASCCWWNVPLVPDDDTMWKLRDIRISSPDDLDIYE